nr:MAG TPA: hypothetical protein [Caudoviricetes sp.]
MVCIFTLVNSYCSYRSPRQFTMHIILYLS